MRGGGDADQGLVDTAVHAVTPTPANLRRAVAVLKRGGIIAYPTEAVYGLGCDPQNASAVRRLIAIKHRIAHKGLILVGASLAQFRPWLRTMNGEQQTRMLASWPGPITWLVPARPNVPRGLRGQHASLAVRVSAHATVRALCEAWDGPLVSTSANISGLPAARTVSEVRRYFGRRVDYIVSGTLGGAAKPCEIRDAITGAVVRGA